MPAASGSAPTPRKRRFGGDYAAQPRHRPFDKKDTNEGPYNTSAGRDSTRRKPHQRPRLSQHGAFGSSGAAYGERRPSVPLTQIKATHALLRMI
jgi:hypothetical protein